VPVMTTPRVTSRPAPTTPATIANDHDGDNAGGPSDGDGAK
jgi:hypothetical protein